MEVEVTQIPFREENVKDDDRIQHDGGIPSIRFRNICQLYGPRSTLNCALSNKCIPCAYKIACFDVALDKEFTSIIPNQRPELCPQSRIQRIDMTKLCQNDDIYNSSNNSSKLGRYHGYHHDMNILTVGDGDFTFSLALARIMRSMKKAEEKNSSIRKRDLSLNTKEVEEERGGGRMIVSSYESLSTLESIYPNKNIHQTISELNDLGVEVLFEVDATRLNEHYFFTTQRKTSSRCFQRIIWNFPCTAEPNGQDGQNTQMDENKEMVKEFMCCANSILDPLCGEIHMAHKTKPPYDQWAMEDIDIQLTCNMNRSDDSLSCINNEKSSTSNKISHSSNNTSATTMIMFLGRVVLDRYCFPPYTPRKALDKKSFTCHDACFYIFGRNNKPNYHGRNNEKSNNSDKSENDTNIAQYFPPTIPSNHDDESSCGSDHDNDLVPITEEVITKIRSLHLSCKHHHNQKHNNKYLNKKRRRYTNNDSSSTNTFSTMVKSHNNNNNRSSSNKAFQFNAKKQKKKKIRNKTLESKAVDVDSSRK